MSRAKIQAELAKDQKDLEEMNTMLGVVESQLANMAADAPNRASSDAYKSTLLALIAELEANIGKHLAALGPETTAAAEAASTVPSSGLSASQTAAQAAAPAPAPQRVYTLQEKVHAKKGGVWTKGTVMNVFGSQSDPKYHIRYDDNSFATLTPYQLKPIETRNRNGTTFTPSAPVPLHNPGGPVISAAANINPEMAKKLKQDSGKIGEGQKPEGIRKKKLKNHKALEKSQANWKSFESKNRKGAKKDSQFRTGEGFGARVGFTGSGQAMRQDGPRKKNKYAQAEAEGDDD